MRVDIKANMQEVIIDGVRYTSSSMDINKDIYVCKICGAKKSDNTELEFHMDINLSAECKTCVDRIALQMETERLAASPIEMDLFNRGYHRNSCFSLLPLDRNIEVVTFDDPAVCMYGLLYGGIQLETITDLDSALEAFLTITRRYANDSKFSEAFDKEHARTYYTKSVSDNNVVTEMYWELTE